jgi:hypothetical protein
MPVRTAAVRRTGLMKGEGVAVCKGTMAVMRGPLWIWMLS